MKKYIIIVLIFICTITFGQNNKKIERIKALRVAYISNKLDLSTEEAQKFWPVFNQFDDKYSILRLQKKQLMFKLKNENASTTYDKEMSKLLEESEEIDDNIQNNRKLFVKNLQGIITPQKILLLKQVEDDFKKELLKQIKNKRQSRN